MSYMMDINPDEIKDTIRQKMSLMAMARALLPYRTDPYSQFKYWIKVGRMPRDKYREMMEILNAD